MGFNHEVEIHEAVIRTGDDRRHPDKASEGVGGFGPEDPRTNHHEITRWQNIIGPEIADGPIIKIGGVLVRPAVLGGASAGLQAT